MASTQVSKSQCTELQSNPGFYLLPDAARAWDRSCAEFGKVVLISGAWRAYETQVQLFDSEKYPSTGRYVRGNRAGQPGYTNDVRGRTSDGGLYRGSWWTRKAGTAAAAVPGTSNHGGGISVDALTARRKGDPGYDTAVIFAGWSDEDRKAFLKIAAKNGWYDTEGRSVDEFWHLTWYRGLDQHRGEKPKTNQQEEPDMDATQARQLSEVHAFLTKPVIPDFDRDQTVEDALRRLLVLGRRATADEVGEVVAAVLRKELAKAPGVDAKAITDSTVAEVRKALKAVENTEYVLTPKES